MAVGAQATAQVRRFNRTVTQRVGALGDRFLATARGLGPSRVLWEVGEEGCEVRSLRGRLGLDSGQLSRVLRGLEAEGLVSVSPSELDGRVRVARLTPKGVAERAVLDRRSDELAEQILQPLDEEERGALLAAMRQVERLTMRSMIDLRVVDPAGADAQRCLRAYYAELKRRSDKPFDPAVGSTADPHEVRAPAGAFVVAYLGEEPMACGAVKHKRGGPSDIKRMWVAESARGLGLGRRLLVELEALARERGAAATRLETNASLTEAIAMYLSAGYAEVAPFNDEPYADHWFEKRLH
jgi:DNA-binding MarR family transcriptional regulator